MSTQQLQNSESSSFQCIQLNKNQINQKNKKDKLYSLQKCQIHRSAYAFGQPLQNSKKCQCCNKKYQKKPLNLCFSKQNISFFGQGLSLYFQFLKMTIIIAFVTLITFAIPVMILNYQGNACQTISELHCSSSFFIKLAAVNKINNLEVSKLQSSLSILAILSIFICVQIFRKRFQDIQQEIQYTAGSQNYAVFCNVFLREEQELKQSQILSALKLWWKKQKSINKQDIKQLNLNEQETVQEIFISYDLHIGKFIKKKTLELIQLVQIQDDFQKLAEYKTEVQNLKIKIQEVQIKTNNKFLILFKYQRYAKYFLDRTNLSKMKIFFCCNPQNKFYCYQNQVQIMKGPLPSQILWQNHHIKGQQKLFKRALVYFVSFILLFSGESLVFLVLYLWFKSGDSQSSLASYISGLVSAFITIINFFLYQIYIIISKFQFRSLLLQDQISKSIKIIISVCFNSGIMLLGAYFIVSLNTIWEYNGFVDTITYTFIYAIITPHIFKYVNLYNILKLHSYIKIKTGNAKLTQVMANESFQLPEGYQCYHYYSWEVTLMWMACFFGPIIPFAFVCVFFTFFIHFWLQKINYIYIYKEPKPWGSLLNKKMTDIIEVSQLLFALGNILLQIILKTLRNQNIQMGPLVISINLLMFTLLHIFILPKDTIIKLITCWYCKEKQTIYKLSYQQAKSKFIISYEQQIKNYFDKKKIKNLDLIKQQLFQKLQFVNSLIQIQQSKNGFKNYKRQTTQGDLIELQQKHNFNSLEIQCNNNKSKPGQLQYFKTLKTIKQESEYFTSKKYQNI